MSFLPIVGRELRVAARLRFTFWSRIVAAAFALLIFVALQSLVMASRGGLGFSAGQIEFSILKWMAFIFALLAGIFLTSDSISEEKREGTLGLLFLTDLRGYDIACGKLISHSLRAFYALLAVFPIMGLTLFAGGVTGVEFAWSLLTICNTLFLSLSAGLLVSTFSRDSTKAMTGTIALLLALVTLLPLADAGLAALKSSRFEPILSMASPFLLFTKIGYLRADEFWPELGIQCALACAFVAVASFFASRTWEEKSNVRGASQSRASRSWRYGSARFRAAIKRKFLNDRPVLWLALRDRWLPRLASLLAVLLLLVQGYSLAITIQGIMAGNNTFIFNPLYQIGTIFQNLFGFGLVIWVATQACRIFVESVRNGALELMLVTPVTPQKIVSAQWTALWRAFLFPAMCVVFLQAAAGTVSAFQMRASLATVSAPVATPAVTNSTPGSNVVVTNYSSTTTTIRTGSGAVVYSSSSGMANSYAFYQGLAVVVNIVTSLTSLASVAWFGMWMGLTTRKVSIAVLKTLCFAYVLPWIAIIFVQMFLIISTAYSGIILGTGRSPYLIVIISSLCIGVLNLSKDAFIIVWSRRRLMHRFREAVAQDLRHRVRPLAAIPPVPPISGEPPLPAAVS